MAQKFLNYEGLLALWAKIKSADALNAESIASLQQQIDSLPSDYSKVDDVKVVDGMLRLFAGEEAVGNGVSVADFIKDGMLDDIEIVEATEENPIQGKTSGKFIKFSWNLSAGSKIEYLDVTELGHVDLGPLTSRVESLESKSSSLESSLAELNTELDAAQADIEALKASTGTGTVNYEDITKNEETGEYVGDSVNAPKTSSVVNALNELKSLITPIDLSDYYVKSEIDDKLELKLNVDASIPVSEIEDLF